MHLYFCSLGKQSVVPPILFIDQPTQVYFPTSIIDTSCEFDAEYFAKIQGKLDKGDADIEAVTNIFNTLVHFCRLCRKITKITPQIIITDHADNLQLEHADFSALVNGRQWRERGFIDISL